MPDAAVAANPKPIMETNFYQRATGRLSKSDHRSYLKLKSSKPLSSSAYSVGSKGEESSQYPTGALSTTQAYYIKEFIYGMTDSNSLEVDKTIRGIHWIGAWTSEDGETTISCTISQPHVVNATIHFQGTNYSLIREYAKSCFESSDLGIPSVHATSSSCQVLGKLAMPFADMLIENGVVEKSRVSWNMIILSQTRPIFIIVTSTSTLECTLTHRSCQIMSEFPCSSVRISHPVTGSHNFAFRAAGLTTGGGTGPSITVHSSGILQYQGKPADIRRVASSFRECILSIMDSEYHGRFIRSLSIIRVISGSVLDESS